MKISRVRVHQKRRRLYNAMITENPVLVLGLGLPFVIAIGVSLKNAAAISIQIFCIHMVTSLFAMVAARLLPPWQRIIANLAVSMVMMVLSRELVTAIVPDILDSAGIYVSLTAINGLTLLQSTRISRRSKLWPVVTSALFNSLAFAVVMIFVSAIREYFSHGTLWGIAIPVPLKFSGVAMPFFGFVLMGFLLAFAKFINKKLLAFHISETVRNATPYIEIQR